MTKWEWLTKTRWHFYNPLTPLEWVAVILAFGLVFFAGRASACGLVFAPVTKSDAGSGGFCDRRED